MHQECKSLIYFSVSIYTILLNLDNFVNKGTEHMLSENDTVLWIKLAADFFSL